MEDLMIKQKSGLSNRNQNQRWIESTSRISYRQKKKVLFGKTEYYLILNFKFRSIRDTTDEFCNLMDEHQSTVRVLKAASTEMSYPKETIFFKESILCVKVSAEQYKKYENLQFVELWYNFFEPHKIILK